MTSVRDWAKAQKYSNAFTHLNMQHLIETFNYVVNDQARMHSVPNWEMLLSQTGVRPRDFDEHIDALFDTPALRMMTVSEFIVLWCRKPGGFVDMLGTVFLMFGRY